MADLKLNQIATRIELIESFNKYRMTEKRHTTASELGTTFKLINESLYYMYEFGIISNDEYKERLNCLYAWYDNYDLAF